MSNKFTGFKGLLAFNLTSLQDKLRKRHKILSPNVITERKRRKKKIITISLLNLCFFSC